MTARIESISMRPADGIGPHRAIVAVADDQRPGFGLSDRVVLPDLSHNSYAMAQAHGYALCRLVNGLLATLPSAYPVDPDTGEQAIDLAGALT